MIRKTRGLWAKINGLSRWVKAGSIIVVAIIGIWGSGYGASAFLDSRYHLKAAAQQEYTDTQVLFMESRRGLLEDQLFRYKEAESRRHLAPRERERKEQIERDLQRIEQEIRSLRRTRPR